MNNPLGDFADEAGEVMKDTAKGIVLETKKQITNKKDKNTDPVTGKPVPTKKALTQLTQATAQLTKTKLEKLRKEMDAMKLPSATPEKKQEEALAKKKSFDVVAQTLKNAKLTGEFGRQVGG